MKSKDNLHFNSTGNSKDDDHADLSKKQRIMVNLTSGAFAGAMAKTLIAPLDRTKINFQTNPNMQYSVKRAAKFIQLTYYKDGVVALWRGHSATLARVVPYAAINFTAHNEYMRLLGITSETKDTTEYKGNGSYIRKQYFLHFIAGSLSGVTGITFTYPLDRTRTVMAVTKSAQHKNIFMTLKAMINNEGYLSLYRGFSPTIVGAILNSGLSFMTYEMLKLKWHQRPSNKDNNEKDLSPTKRIIYGATAGFLGNLTAYPLEIVRKRMQTVNYMQLNANIYQSVFKALMHISRTEGVRGLYKGITMNLIKGPIAYGTAFTINDYYKILMRKILLKPDDVK